MAATMKINLPTTVFLIDDDPTVLRRFTKESLRHTNLGVLTAEDLPTAVKLLDENYPIGAILADIHFRPETQDQGRNIHSGLDFLKYVEKMKPNIPVYVMSMDADDRSSRREASDMGLHVREWYDKSHLQQSQYTPWVRIERDLILQALKSKPDFRAKASESGENPIDLLTDEHLAEKVRKVFNYPRLTYLQYLPKVCGYQLKKPIEVHCWPDQSTNPGQITYRAKAVRIPLLVEVEGEDLVEAIDKLANLLAYEKRQMDSEDEAHVSGYARFIKDQLGEHIEPKPTVGTVKATTTP